MTIITHKLYSDLFNRHSDLRTANEKTEKNLEDAKVLIDALSKENDMERTKNFSLERDNLRLHNMCQAEIEPQAEIERLKLAHHKMCQEYEKLETKCDAIEEARSDQERQLEQAKTLIDSISSANDRERTNSFSLERENLRLHRTAEHYAKIKSAYSLFAGCSIALNDVLDSHGEDFSNDYHVKTARDRLILLFHMTLKSIIERSSIDPIDTASFRPPSNVDEIPF